MTSVVNYISLSAYVTFLTLSSNIDLDMVESTLPHAQFNTDAVDNYIAMGETQEKLNYFIQNGLHLNDKPQRSISYYASGLWPNNLADSAALHFNLPALKALKEKGIVPSNMPGWVTGLDFALQGTIDPKYRRNNPQDELKKKQIEVVQYLIDEGYQAHRRYEAGDLNRKRYHLSTSPFPSDKRNGSEQAVTTTVVDEASNTHLMSLLEQVEFIDITNYQSGVNEADLTPEVIRIYEQYVALQNSKVAYEQNCADLLADKLSANRLMLPHEIETYQATANSKKTLAKQISNLHKKDPALATAAQIRIVGEYQNDWLNTDFARLLRSRNMQRILDYFAQTELSEDNQTHLFYSLIAQPKLISTLNATIGNKRPYTLLPFARRIQQGDIETLLSANFDFSQLDSFGNDVFTLLLWLDKWQVVESIAQTEEINLSFNNPEYGADALDALLDEIFVNEHIPELAELVIEQFPMLEPNHLRRLARLQRFRPELYNELTMSFEQLALSNEFEPSEMLIIQSF